MQNKAGLPEYEVRVKGKSRATQGFYNRPVNPQLATTIELNAEFKS